MGENSGPSTSDLFLQLEPEWQQRPPGPALFVFGFTAGVVFDFGATADVSRLVKQIPGDSAKSQKQITLSGEEIF